MSLQEGSEWRSRIESDVFTYRYSNVVFKSHFKNITSAALVAQKYLPPSIIIQVVILYLEL